MSPNPDVAIYAKLEFLNPTGSVKDRVAKALIEDLEASGRLRPDSIILEPTSGNTGIALAMIARRKGYRVAVVLPDNVTHERRQLLRCSARTSSIRPARWAPTGPLPWRRSSSPRIDRYVMPYQYGNPANPAVA